MFRTNLDLKKYTPWYDYYDEFLQKMIERARATDPSHQKVEVNRELLPFERLYQFESCSPA